ncbi:hypothetical protein PVK64_05235 [Aliivibrio sp. S4TY2]|uniref:hypothetical protein n=1 Tax=unclassified Aliivibrio TaxID=2645654 RepID=UPI0023786413|nr:MULTISPECIES: hypothetical protein [unclassified Aliivibrio]MDD9155585.1 hypothetical protein [Aliivibrio sp. S4TY2]MDD9160452.1 hypothetical protein [Aliivibrio sp. S4TY1]MDD9164650.1 hypothetical protein [Aliivibrio sp. S4MY2]MDD9168456.1 hypothetical protein [Aliivibrio sp. S4MY4]MDD9184984.1 hypothetical protein [Aliivibrio sp. S4MY3]
MPIAEAAKLTREMPSLTDLKEGIISGKYKVWGGVVRLAKGQRGAGQIVGHLVIPDNADEALDKLGGQLGTMQKQLSGLQSLQIANLAMSGLNLAVSAAGFAIVCKKLDHISCILKSHTEKLDSLLDLAQKQDLRNTLSEAARFSGIIKSARQFSETGEFEQLKSLIRPINEQYEFTKYLLLDATRSAAKHIFIASIDEVECLSDRLVHLALIKAHINQKVGHTQFAIEAMEDLQKDWLNLNQNIVTAFTENKAFVSGLSIDSASKVRALLEFRQKRLPAIEYQTNVLKLLKEKPETAQLLDVSNDQILFIAA